MHTTADKEESETHFMKSRAAFFAYGIVAVMKTEKYLKVNPKFGEITYAIFFIKNFLALGLKARKRKKWHRTYQIMLGFMWLTFLFSFDCDFHQKASKMFKS